MTFADVRFGPGSLHGAIARLESRGLIQALEAQDRRNPSRPGGGDDTVLSSRQ